MDAAVSRKIKHAARHVVAARWVDTAPSEGGFGAGLAGSLGALGFGDPDDALAEGGLERLAAQVRVTHGDRALTAFELHVGLQLLTVTAARGGAERRVLLEMTASIAAAARSLELAGVSDAVEGVAEQLREDCTASATLERIATLDSAVDRALGIRDTLRHGRVPHLELSFAEA